MQKASIPACLAAVTLTLSLAACSFPGVYRIDVQQGNIIDQEDLGDLNPTMSRADVRDLLGTPITVSSFNPDREYYLYTFQEGGGEIRKQRVTIIYEGNQYLRHEAKLLEETPAN
ncbi:outer membrane protein assembly factor BamE [Salicola sp. Rm-C-2C1-2]|uniref:outer membrane protein assembly factor BamE n=1 Tax=Salicola sp. Rm-C-2C1-2 TaxID=3141321 RepID=UPI0032E44B5B